MRWLFLIVLSFNLAYIAWQTTRPVTQSYEHVRPLKNVPPIVLLSESKQQAHVMATVQTSLLQNDDANKQQEALAGPEVNSGKQQPSLQPQIVAVAETVETAPVKKTEEIKPPALTLDKDNIVVETVVEIKPLKRPDELQEKPLMSMGGEDFASSQEGGAIPKASCFTLGPFRDLDKLRSLTREIKSYVVTADFRGREEKEQTLHWVYIKPEKNRTKAIETGKRLKAKKIKDFFVIRDGEKINGLSLGRFRNKNGAYGLAKKVTNLGFNVMVEPVFKTYTIYWLDYQLASGVNIPGLIFEKYVKSSKKDKISRLSRDCNR